MFAGSAFCYYGVISMPDYIAIAEPMMFTIHCEDVPQTIDYFFNVAITGYEPPLLHSFATPWNPYVYSPNTTINATAAVSFVPDIRTTGSPGNTTLYGPLVFPLGTSVHLITVVGTRANRTYTWTVHRPYWTLQPSNLQFDGTSASAQLTYSIFTSNPLALFLDETGQQVGNVTVTPVPTMYTVNPSTSITLWRNGIAVGRNATTTLRGLTSNFALASCSPCTVFTPSISIVEILDAPPWSVAGGTVALAYGLNMPWNVFRDVDQPMWQLNVSNTANDGLTNYTWDVNTAVVQYYQGQMNQTWEIKVWDHDEAVPLTCGATSCLVNSRWTKSVQWVQIPVGFTKLTIQNAVFNASSGQWDAGKHTTGPVQVAASFGCDGIQGPANWTISPPGATVLRWTCQNRWSGELVEVNATIVSMSVSAPPIAPSPFPSTPPPAPSIVPARPTNYSLNTTDAGLEVSVVGFETSEDGNLQIIVTSNIYIDLATSFSRILITPNAAHTQFIITGLPDQDPCTPDTPYDVFITSIRGNTSTLHLGSFIHRNVVPVSLSTSPAVGSLLGRNVTLKIQGLFNFTWNAIPVSATWSCLPQTLLWTVPHSNFTGYAKIVLNPDTSPQIAPDVFFYTEDCPEEGQFGVGLDCRPCPTGAECPGGNRIIAKPGYWNRGESSGFVQKCADPSTRCLGRGLCAPGYTGDFCTQCAPHYYTEGAACQPCGSSKVALVTLVIIIIGFFGVLYAGVFFASNEILNGIVGTLTTIQLITAAGNVPVINMPNWMHQYYRLMGLFSFDARVARPECSGISGFRGRLYIMLGYSFIAFFPILVLFFTRRERTIRCATIVASIIYYSMTMIGFTGIACTRIHGTFYLQSDLTIRCARSWTTYICALIATCAVVFPGWAMHRAWRFFTLEERYKEKHKERYGFFYEEVKVFWYVPTSIVLLFIDAIIAAFAPNWFQSALTIVVLSMFGGYTFVYKPYHEHFNNVTALLGLAASILLAIASLLVPHLTPSQVLWTCVFTISISVGLLFFMMGSTGWAIYHQKRRRRRQLEADTNFANALHISDPHLPQLIMSPREQSEIPHTSSFETIQ